MKKFALFVLSLALLFAASAPAQSGAPATAAPTTAAPDTSAPTKVTGKPRRANFRATVLAVKYWDITEGTGPAAKSGDTVTIQYTGWLTNGKKVDSSVDRKKALQFVLGSEDVIMGWEAGIKGMKAGGKRQLLIPSDLAYGRQGAPPVIPAYAELIFDVELLKIGK